jgi:hypothetical protein
LAMYAFSTGALSAAPSSVTVTGSDRRPRVSLAAPAARIVPHPRNLAVRSHEPATGTIAHERHRRSSRDAAPATSNGEQHVAVGTNPHRVEDSNDAIDGLSASCQTIASCHKCSFGYSPAI